MKQLEKFIAGETEKVSLIISDVDDTITTHGKLHPEALSAMYEAVEKGYRIILLSGGSAGWCEVYLRQWPVFMVIAESGAVMIYKDEDGNIRYQRNPVISEDDLRNRETLMRMIGEEYLSSDQYARLYDIAVDLKLVPSDRIQDIKEAADNMGAHYAFSSIHMNIWFGDYSKEKGILTFMDLCGIDSQTLCESSIYFGDAPNDSGMFSLIPLSVGTLAVERRRSEFQSLPAYFAPFEGGEGFAYGIRSLLGARKA